MSVTVQVTGVVPSGKFAGASFVTVATPQLSEVTGVPKERPEAEQLPASVLADNGGGQVMTGGMLSCTVTFCAQVAVFP
jgi:hypothetical protein